jgi:predicted secreted Zn-dependent protease
MKRRTARQLVRLLSDIRHAAHCSTLRAAATNRAIAQASAEHDADLADSDDNTDATRDAHQNKPARSRS